MATVSKSGARLDAAIGSLVFLLVAPGMVAGLVPWIISRWRLNGAPDAAPLRPIGLVLIALGMVVLLEAFARFALEGLGTPAPIYPTDRLIVRGSYRFVRNPMYLAVEALILGQAALFGAFDLVIYAAMIAVAFHLFVVLVEEPTLRRNFATDYRRYSANVHRWLPRLLPWNGMQSEKQPPAAKPPASTDREKRLAEALRANLKRRKAAVKAVPAGKQSPK